MGLDIIDSLQRSGARQAQAGYLAQVARNQAELQRRQAGQQDELARRAEQQGAADEDRRRLDTAGAIGRQRALLAMQGGDINDGSAPDLAGDLARTGAFDALSIRDDAARRAWGFRIGAMEAANRAGLSEAAEADQWRRVREAGDRGALEVTRSLLGGASQLASLWL